MASHIFFELSRPTSLALSLRYWPRALRRLILGWHGLRPVILEGRYRQCRHYVDSRMSHAYKMIAEHWCLPIRMIYPTELSSTLASQLHVTTPDSGLRMIDLLSRYSGHRSLAGIRWYPSPFTAPTLLYMHDFEARWYHCTGWHAFAYVTDFMI